MTSISIEALEALRDQRYYRTPALRVRSEPAALAFINQVGFCFLFHDRVVEMPTLIDAISGSRRSYVNDHHDADIGRAWEWKDSLPVRGAVYYGKQLRAKPTLVALRLLPAFYALSPNFGELDDYLQEFEAGTLSRDARTLYEVLLERGPLATTHLRRYGNLWGGGETARRFERAITELQIGMKIVKSGISDVSRWGYAYVYDLFLRRFPDVPQAARQISRECAMEILITQHLTNVVAASEKGLRQLFRWDEWSWSRLMEGLRARNAICALTITDSGESWLGLRDIVEQL